MTAQSIHVACGVCGHQTHVVPAESYACPACGAVGSLHVSLTLGDTAEAHESIRTKGYSDQGKEFLDARSGDSYFRKDDEWHEIVQVVDRSSNRYVKRIVRKSTGEVLRDDDGPLTEHRQTARGRAPKPGDTETGSGSSSSPN